MRTSPIFFYRSRGPTSSRRWDPPPAFGAQGCRSLGSRACERITLNAKIAKHLFERFFLCGLRGLCVDVISSHPLMAVPYRRNDITSAIVDHPIADDASIGVR